MSTERKLQLEKELHEYLHQHHIKMRELSEDTMMYDPTGKSSFIVIGFNKVTDPDLLPEDATAHDKEAAVACASSMIDPAVNVGGNTQVGAEITLPIGVQAVAASMLLGSLQNGALVDTMKMAQHMALEYHIKIKALN